MLSCSLMFISNVVAIFVFQSYSNARFTIYDANRTLTFVFLGVFLIALIIGFAALFIRGARRFVGILLSVPGLCFLGVIGYAISSDLSPWPFPYCLVIIEILSIVLILLGRKSA